MEPSPSPATISERWESQDRLVTQLSAPVGMSWETHTHTHTPTSAVLVTALLRLGDNRQCLLRDAPFYRGFKVLLLEHSIGWVSNAAWLTGC